MASHDVRKVQIDFIRREAMMTTTKMMIRLCESEMVTRRAKIGVRGRDRPRTREPGNGIQSM